MNPIEEAFSKVKYFIRRNASIIGGADDIIFDMYCCMHVVTASDAQGYFAHAGYV